MFWLTIRRGARHVLKGVGYYFSFVFLIFSISISIMLLFPHFFHRVPVYSYFVSELSLPISYTLTGSVEILDENDNSVVRDVEIYIGGYSTKANRDGTFSLKFTAVNAIEVPIVIYYTSSSGQLVTQIENLKIKEGVYIMEKEFLLNE